MASLFSMSTKLCNQHLLPGLIEVKIIEVKKKISFHLQKWAEDRPICGRCICLHGNRDRWGFSAATMKNAANNNTRHCDFSHTHCVMNVATPHTHTHTHTHRRTHTQNTCLGCHEARNVFLFLYILVKFLAQDEEKDKIYSGLVFSEAVNCVFLTGTLSFCTHLSVQPFTLGDSRALRLKMTLFWKLTMKT